MHIATNSTGNLRVCCNAVPTKSYIYKSDGKPYKLFRDDINEAWHSESYKSIRQDFLNGNKPEICERCFREEDAGLKSARQSANEQWGTECSMTTTPKMDIRYVRTVYQYVKLINVLKVKKFFSPILPAHANSSCT